MTATLERPAFRVNFVWTKDAVETVARLWMGGVSASEIAKQIPGLTRNAIVGKMHRLEIPTGRAQPVPVSKREARIKAATVAHGSREKHATPEVKGYANRTGRDRAPRQDEAAPAPTRQRAGNLTNPFVPSNFAHKRERHPTPIVPVEIPLHATGDGKTLLELAPGDCRWPSGDPRSPTFRFCAAPAEPGRPYCAHHAARSRAPLGARVGGG